MGSKRTLKPRGATRGDERRRLLVHGAEALAPVELVACIIGGAAATMRAGAVLEGIGGLGALARAEPWQVLQDGQRGPWCAPMTQGPTH